MDDHSKGLIRWLFEDRTSDRIVVAQAPNALLWLFLVALAATYLVPAGGKLALTTRIVMIASLALWALDELLRGVNPWRRLLGVATLVGIVVWWRLR